MLIRVSCLAFHQCVGKHITSSFLQLCGGLTVNRFELRIQLKPEITAPPLDQ
jgi:hypothetical protein